MWLLSQKVSEDIFRKQLERLVGAVANHLQQGSNQLALPCIPIALLDCLLSSSGKACNKLMSTEFCTLIAVLLFFCVLTAKHTHQAMHLSPACRQLAPGLQQRFLCTGIQLLTANPVAGGNMAFGPGAMPSTDSEHKDMLTTLLCCARHRQQAQRNSANSLVL